MPDIVGIIRSIVKEELRGHRTAELGVVTKLYPHISSGDKNNYSCNVKLKDTELELQNVGIATQRIGSAAIPDINDLVLVQFIGGDVNSPVVTGCVYNDKDRPPVSKEHELVYVSPHSPESGVRRVYLEFPNGNTMLLNDDELKIEVGKTKITVKNSGDVTLECDGTLKIETTGDTSINAKGKISLDATSEVNISATNIAIKAQATGSLEAGASATIKGAVLSLKGMADFSPG